MSFLVEFNIVVLLAQMMPGMEWIPVMEMVTVGGLLCGVVGLLLRIFGSSERAGLLMGKMSVGIGLGSAILFLVVEGTRLFPIAYLILATPVVPGLITLVLPTGMRVRVVLRVLSGVLAIGVIAGVAWVWREKTLPADVIAENPAEYRWPPSVAIDEEGQLFSKAFDGPVTGDSAVVVDVPVLDEFSGSERQLLLRHLATSAKWFVGKEMVRGVEKLTARRRYVRGGMWLNPLNGYFNEPGDQIRILIGLNGSVYANGFGGLTTYAKSDQGTIELKTKPTSSGSQQNDSYLVVTSAGAALEVFEQSARKDRPFTAVALSQLNQELRGVLSSAVAKERGFDPALMPRESIWRGKPEMHLVNYEEEEGTYQAFAYVNPGESGYVYLKTFEGRGNSQISGEEYYKRKSIEYVGWSSDPEEEFFYNTEVEFGEPAVGKTHGVRVEMWFVPEGGGAERKLLERYFEVK